MDSMGIYLLYISLLASILSLANSKGTKELFAKLTENYDNTELPSSPTEVKIGLYINSIDTSKLTSDSRITYTMYFRHQWLDERLAFDQSEYGNDVLLPPGADSAIWMPDIFIKNQIKSEDQDGISRDNILLKLSHNGKIWAVKHMSVTLACNLMLQKYPYDTQKCAILMESFKYKMTEMYLSWLDISVSVDTGLQLQNFMLKDSILYDCSQNYTSGSFTCLEVQLVLERDRGNHVLQFFLPSIIIIVISWFALWMSADNFSSRMQYLLTLLFLLMLVYAMAAVNATPTSYVRMMDVWMLICVLMIILAMLQSLLLIVLQPGNNKPPKGDQESSGDHVILLGKPYNAGKARRVIDIGARAGLPVLYLIIIIIFFSLYN